MKGTHTFARNVTRMWNILNIKSPPTVGIRLNDDDRQPFIDSNDERLTFLVDMATCFRKMNNSVLGKRMRGFTNHTSNELHLTINGFVDVIKTLLSSEYTYVLPGKIQSDRVEAEFGIYRQSSGGNFLISAEQVISSLQLQRLKLFRS